MNIWMCVNINIYICICIFLYIYVNIYLGYRVGGQIEALEGGGTVARRSVLNV
jgi:hypothetical protein